MTTTTTAAMSISTMSTSTSNSSTRRTVRRCGAAIPTYFLGRHRDQWTVALAPSAFEFASAA